MKFQIFSFLLSTLSLPHANAAELTAMTSPQCVNFEPIRMVGDAKFEGADPRAPLPAVGDMSIGSYEGTPKTNRFIDDFGNQGVSIPEQPGGFKQIGITYDSE